MVRGVVEDLAGEIEAITSAIAIFMETTLVFGIEDPVKVGLLCAAHDSQSGLCLLPSLVQH